MASAYSTAQRRAPRELGFSSFECRAAVCLAAASALFGGRLQALDPARSLGQYVHRSWDTDDGLPQDSVMSMLRSRSGYLWMGTREGAARFDGLGFTVFDRRALPALRSNVVHALCEDRAGRLWLGTSRGGLTRLDPDGSARTYTHRDGAEQDVRGASPRAVPLPMYRRAG